MVDRPQTRARILRFQPCLLSLAATLLLAATALSAHAAERITLRNGFSLECVRRETAGDRVRLYLRSTLSDGDAATGSYIEVSQDAILLAEPIPAELIPMVRKPDLPEQFSAVGFGARAIRMPVPDSSSSEAALTPAEMHELLARAGARHNIDADLLAAVVHAESNGDAHAVSRAGAQGLMQLMPATAGEVNVKNSFAPEQNVGGGSAYLDQLLTHYHDNLALALAAYNAGPAAVDRYHGIPPYAETRAYVARVIREFNRRKTTAQLANSRQVASAQ